MDQNKIVSVQFIDNYFPIVDGVVHTVHNYALNMCTDSSVAVATPKAKAPYDDSVYPYKVIRTKTFPLPFLEYSAAAPWFDAGCKKEIGSLSADIFHAHSPLLMGHFAVSLGKKLGVPVVSTFHSKYYDDALNITGSKALAEFVKRYVVRHYNKADAVWACSNGTADTLRSYGFKKDIFVMENGSSMQIPEEKWDELKRAAKQKFALPEDKHVLLFVGHLIKHKNLPLILDTMRILCDKCDYYRLIIAGDGYDGEEIKKYAESLCFTNDQVRFIGRVYDKELLAGLYLCSGLFFFPSVYDNAPLVVREAAAMRLPSLLTEGSNSAEAVIPDVTGYTAKEDAAFMCEKIQAVFKDEDARKKVGSEAQRVIPKTFAQITAQVREKYAEIIEKYNFENKKTAR